MRVLAVAALAAVVLATAPAAEAKDKNCPPGLAKKTPACVPPGQAKKNLGNVDRRDRHDEPVVTDRRQPRDTDRDRLRQLISDLDDLTAAERRELRNLWENASLTRRERMLALLTQRERRQLDRALDLDTADYWRFEDGRRDLLRYGDRTYRTGDRLPDGSYVVIDGDRLRLYPSLDGGRQYVQLNDEVVAVVDATGTFIRALSALRTLSN